MEAETSLNQFYEDKELLVSRIRDLDFVDEVSEFECKRCGNVLIHHYISNCGHAFCANCRSLLGDGSGRWKCPQCQEYVKQIGLQDFEFERKLFDLRVRCANNKYGCSFTCLLKELAVHLRTCKSTRESALPVISEGPNTSEMVLGQMLSFNQKFDKFNADFEKMKEKIAKIENNQETFDNKINTINNHIDLINQDFLRERTSTKMQLSEIKNNQVLESLNLTNDKFESEILNLNQQSDLLWEGFKGLELKDKKLSKAIQVNEDNVKSLKSVFQDVLKAKIEEKSDSKNDHSHLKTMEEKIEENKKELVTLKSVTATTLTLETQLKDMESSMESVLPHLFRLESVINMLKLQVQPVLFKDIYLKRQADFLWNISDAKTMLKLNKFEIKSEAFRLNEYPFQAQAKLKSENGVLLLSVSLKNFTGAANGSKLQHSPSVYLILRKQVDERDWDISRCASKDFDSPPNSDYIFLGIDKSMLDGFFSNYINDDVLTLELHVEPPSMTAHAHSHDGSLSWAIESYRKRKESESSRYAMWNESPYFYTSQRGYRVQVRVLLSYMDTGVAAEIKFLEGEFDQKLGGSFPHKTTVTVLNQKHPNGHVINSKIQLGIEKSAYRIYLGSHKEIEKLIENDTLYYHVKIEST